MATELAVWDEQMMARMIALRDEYVALGADELALAVDDMLEDHGMDADERRTCYRCSRIVDETHSHSW